MTVALTGLPIGYSVTVALTGLPIGYSVTVALTCIQIFLYNTMQYKHERLVEENFDKFLIRNFW